ncbi:unnamed protein product, partial [Rotaria sp. Silwood1]
VGAHFNIIRFGSNFDILFKNETLTAVYDEQTAKEAEKLTRSMQADFGGTELLEPLKHLKDHPPIKDRSRQIFLLTDGEISNTNEVTNEYEIFKRGSMRIPHIIPVHEVSIKI